ncbi:MAG: hypothetical protein ACOYJ8_02820 [Patescibacteria group bacterium]|jgi:hypothetical protein
MSTVVVGEFKFVVTEFPDKFRVRLFRVVDQKAEEISVFEGKGALTKEGRKEDLICWLRHNAPEAEEKFQRLMTYLYP